jgi:RNA polymerase sigma factor (sigma-70 family)
MPTTSESRTEIFTKLFAESRQALHRYIQRFVGSSETAKEIVQEAFLRTYRQRESVTTLRAFLFSTARNLAANEYRHRRIAEKGALGDLCDSWAATERESLEAELLRDERNRLILEAIDRLPPQCRAAFTLRVFHQCSYKEVAERLGRRVRWGYRSPAPGPAMRGNAKSNRRRSVCSPEGPACRKILPGLCYAAWA